MPKNSSTITDIHGSDEDVLDEEDPGKAALASRRSRIVRQVHDYAHKTRDVLKVAGEEETQRLLEGLEHIPLTEDEIAGWERTVEMLHSRHLESGKALKEKTQTILGKAYADKLISRESRDRWLYERFENAAINFKAREYFVNYQLPSYVRAWETVKRQRGLLEKNPIAMKLTSREVKDIEKFHSESSFLTLHYDAKVNLVSAVQAAVNAKKRKQDALYSEAKRMLEATAAAGFLAESKVGVWLHRLFSRNHTSDEIAKFVRGTLKRTFIPNWTKVRYRYDRTERQMEDAEIRGFQRLPPHKFLMLTYEQRESYVDEAERRLRIHENVEEAQKSKLYDMKLRIRHDLDTEDWEGADELIQEAEKIATGEDVHEIESMKRYLTAFRDRKKEEQTPMQDAEQALEEMRTAFAQIPIPLRSLYFSALTIGYPTLESICSLIYNRIWCWEHGFLDAKIEEELHGSAASDTQRVLKEGHRKRGRENIDLDAVDDIQAPGAVRTYDRGEWGATVIHYSPESRGKLLARVGENRGFAFNYWTTLVPKDVPYVQQQSLVHNVNWVLKKGLRTLRKHQVPFTLTGKPMKLAASSG